jgi:ubiquitin C-terminal hydrolase
VFISSIIGAIAEVFGMLLKNMWSGEFESIAPKKFKHVLGKWAPQFEGFSQHDSQEFLGTLLDGLHEDLNRLQPFSFI